MKTSKILTKKWKQKQLKEGYYYIKTSTGRIEISHLHWWYEILSGVETPTELAFDEYMYDEILLILASVPTYEKNKAMQKKLSELKQENKQLRTLLRECLPIVSAEIITWQIRGGEESRKRGQDLLTRINAALGESEEK